jgi:hypothetical protein
MYTKSIKEVRGQYLFTKIQIGFKMKMRKRRAFKTVGRLSEVKGNKFERLKFAIFIVLLAILFFRLTSITSPMTGFQAYYYPPCGDGVLDYSEVCDIAKNGYCTGCKYNCDQDGYRLECNPNCMGYSNSGVCDTQCPNYAKCAAGNQAPEFQTFNFTGTQKYFNVFWNVRYPSGMSKQIAVECTLNCDPNPNGKNQNCNCNPSTGKCLKGQMCLPYPYTQMPGAGSCTVANPVYNYTGVNEIICRVYDPENPNLENWY